MNEVAGKIFSIAKDNIPVPGCTISKSVYEQQGYHLLHFSLAEHTDISAETYQVPKLIYLDEGELEIFTKSQSWHLKTGDAFILPQQVPVGMRAMLDSIYTELALRKDSTMNQILKAGEVFKLKDLLPYQEGKIVNMDLINDPKLKFVIMSFSEGTGLSEHAAPGEALIFALDGEGVIGYEGKEYAIKAGENFKFAKNGLHFVRAKGNFKMALLLTLE